jgi:glycosyltransferase involved in cell wall biosynthesis
LNNKIHVCIITTAHPVDDVRVNFKFAHSFHAAGFRVSWVGPRHAFFDCTNYNRDNIQFLLTHPNRNRVDRLLAPFRVRKLAAVVTGVDVYYSPDPDSASVALHLAQLNGAKVIFDVHEVYHGALLDRWLMGRRLPTIRNFLRQRIARICSQCDLVIGVSDAVLSPYLTHASRFMVVRNCAPSWFAIGKPAEICGMERKSFRIMHGKSDQGNGTMQVIEAAAISSAQIPELLITMFKSSNGVNDTSSQTLISRIQKLQISKVIDLRTGVAMQEIPEILQTCDVGLIAYSRDLGVDSLPNRLFEYMAAGLAIIAPVYAREIAKIIETEKCGILVDFEDPADIARAIVQLRQDPHLCREMGRHAREAFLKRHNWEAEVRPVIECIQKWQTDTLK